MPSTLRKCDALGCYENALCCYGRCAAHCQTYCQTHRVDTYSAAPMPRRAPEGRHGYLGIEFKVVPRYGTSRSDMARIARHVCDDCSVRGDNGSGVECKVLAWCDRAPAVVTGWLQRLHAARGGCPITVNRSCGLHVHLDTRGVDRYRVETFTAALHSAADDWQRIVPPSRRRGAEKDKTLGSNNCTERIDQLKARKTITIATTTMNTGRISIRREPLRTF